MGCPKAYDDKLKAEIAATNYNRTRKSAYMVPFKCNKCPKWHLRNEG